MSNEEGLKMRGIAEIKELDPETGEVLDEWTEENIVVADAGLEWMASEIADASTTTADKWTYMAIGEGDGTGGADAEDLTDTSLQASVAHKDVSADTSVISADPDGKGSYSTVVRFGPLTFESGVDTSSQYIIETGIKDSDATDGTADLFDRIVFDSAADMSSRDLQVTIYIDVGNRGYTV